MFIHHTWFYYNSLQYIKLPYNYLQTWSVVLVSKINATVEPAKYVPFLKGDEALQVYVTAVVPNKFITLETLRVPLLKPEIKLEVIDASSITSGTPFQVRVSFKNPLDVPLRSCKAYFGGAILQKAFHDTEIA